MSELSLEDVLDREQLEIRIDDFGYTGEGFVRLADGWLSVPGALPGERVQVAPEHPEHLQGRRVFAQLIKVLDPSDARRPPLCDRDDICRGCQLRHMSIAEELGFKRRTVSEVVEKFADVPPEDQPEVEVVTPRPIHRGDAYRIRSRLTYDPTADEKDSRLGLVSPVRSAPISMGTCPALTEPARRLVQYVESSLDEQFDDGPDNKIREALSRLETIDVASPVFGRGLIKLSVSPDAPEGPADAISQHPPIERWLADLSERVPKDVGIAVSAGSTVSHVSGPDRISLPIAGARMSVSHYDWFPATIPPTEKVYDTTLEWLEVDRGNAYLDVGCGVGTLSMLIGEEVDRVVGVDRNPRTIESAELNAVRHDLEHVEFRPSHWEKALRTLAMEGASFDIATINPMREPLGERALTYLRRLDVQRLVYLGPSPESAAKDLNALLQGGWCLDRLAAGNVHPASYHTMLMARLSRTA